MEHDELMRMIDEHLNEKKKIESKEILIDEIIKLVYSEGNDFNLGSKVRKMVFTFEKYYN